MPEPIIPERLRRGKKRPRSGLSRQLGLIGFSLAALALVAYGASYFFFPKPESFQLDFYTYAQVGTRDFLEVLGAKGIVVPQRIVAVEAKIAGVIEEILVQEGQDVQAGDPLLKLYSQEVLAEKDSAQTELEQARVELEQLGITQELEMTAQLTSIYEAQDRLEKAAEQLELKKVLFEYGAIPRRELEEAEKEMAAAERLLAQSRQESELLTRVHAAAQSAAQRKAALAQEKLARSLEKIENFVVKAPLSGRILALKIPNNRVVAPHQDLGELADLSHQVVELQVAPGQVERFSLGTAVDILLGQNQYRGEIAAIAPQAKQGTEGPTVAVLVEFKDEVSHLRPNSAVTANIHLGRHQDSLYLPRGAYLSSGQQLFVYVLEGQSARRREVQFGLLEGNAVQILRGLELGEEVIISSYDAFRHLEEIQILPKGGHSL